MEKKITAFTVFTCLLLAVSGARISLDPPATDLPVVQSTKSSPESASVADSNIILPSELQKSSSVGTGVADSNIILPSELQKSSSVGTGHLPESEKFQTFTVDVTPRQDFASFHPINRHFLDEPTIPHRFIHRRPNRHSVYPFMIPRSEISYGNDVILPSETDDIDDIDSRTFHRQAPLKRLRFKHDYGHRHHRRHHHRHDNNGGFVQKHIFDREKLKSFARQHREKNREHEASFMKRIRKFLKHSFE